MSEWFLLHNLIADFLCSAFAVLNDIFELLGCADTSEQVCNLVGVHARSWYLNWSGPVEIVVRKGESKLLDLNFSQGGLV